MSFNDDDPILCEECNKYIFPGDYLAVFNHSGKDYKCCTSADCMSSLLYKIFEEDFELVKILTAEDKADKYADMQGD